MAKYELNGDLFDSKEEAQFYSTWCEVNPDLELTQHYTTWESQLSRVLNTKKRRRHVDFAHVASKTAIEYNGGLFSYKKGKPSGHVGKGALRDYLKQADLGVIGWAVFYVGTSQETSHEMAAKIGAAIRLRMKLWKLNS